VPGWLSTRRSGNLVSGIEDAARNHGGQGALYVRMRRLARTRGGAMTPFGEKRSESCGAERGVAQKDMAAALGVSAAYLSALWNTAAAARRLGNGAEGHRLFQRHLGRGGGAPAPGRNV
jgi:hypothetical protein